MRLFDSTNIPLLNKALDTYAVRQKVTASNIANITTPGYKSQSVAFEEYLSDASGDQSRVRGAATHDRHMPVGAPADVRRVEAQVHDTGADPPEGYDEMTSGFNDVDIDFQMAELAKNQIRFKFGSKLLGETFRGMQKAIRGTL